MLLQALELTLYLMQFGNDQIIDDLRQQQWVLNKLTNFSSSRSDTTDLDAQINEQSKKVKTILESDDAVRDLRNKRRDDVGFSSPSKIPVARAM